MPSARSRLTPEPLTVAEFLARQRAGSLPGGPRAELVAGVVRVPPLPSASAVAAVVGLAARLELHAAGRWNVQLQPPVRLGAADLLRPDLALLREAPRFGGAAAYAPADVLLVVEAMHGDPARDQRLPRLALARVPEVWWIDVARRWTEVYRTPAGGRYRSRTLWYPGEALRPVLVPEVSVEPLTAF